MDLSVIYPVHISFQTRYILKRLQACLTNTNEGLPDAEHVIILSGRNRYVRKAQKLAEQLPFAINIIIDNDPTRPYSPGIARNRAVQHTTKNNLIFWDIDLLGSPQLFRAIPNHLQEIEKNPKAFHMYPCMYLCKEYSKHFKEDFERLWEDATNLRVNTLEHFAMATSTILCNKQHFLDIGAFDEEFIGHMGEDLELLNRLSIAYGKYPFEKDHTEDWPSKVPAELKGFRKHFALCGLDHLKEQLFTCHLSHSTRLGSLYKNSNTENRNLLIDKIKQKTEASFLGSTPSYWPKFLTETPNIKKGYLEVAFRKCRKLLKKPNQFFKDIH
ncbi:hypothetical protein HF888_03445 [Bermanella marisrubri]|uniref:Glycosyltransferase 2-like prokaryotic type domain-containing protein n=1 Tax=Bermanella marisrubri TaxID=207949 RepID=Q1N0A0_9GAMM|nr:hypothetical protein [Bermanella marisrubri]EAT11617.1 hypothetical protein RED65_08009 [Oceanobacter sp. RED65] [Bermanella marisrubri]QIZ83340.1 hypothetical protein HF888_03445 [Bermanella marisrubri]